MASVLELLIRGEDLPSSPYGGKVEHTPISLKLAPAEGTDDDEFNSLVAVDPFTVDAADSDSINLQSLVDAFKVAPTLDDVALLYIEHKLTSLSSSIELSADSPNGFTNLLSTTAALKLRPGDFIILGALKAGNLPVSGTNKLILITNNDGVNAADLVVHVWGRK